MGQVEDSEQAEQVHGDIGSPLATGIEEEGDESSQFPSTQQLFGADSSYVENTRTHHCILCNIIHVTQLSMCYCIASRKMAIVSFGGV